MPEYLNELAKALAAPAIVLAVVGALGKWYLDKVLGRQTEQLKTSLAQETERLKFSLANEVAVTQAKLQALQQVSKSVYAARRACRDLNEVIFPQSDAQAVRLTRLSAGDGKQLVNLVNDKNIALGEASFALEEKLHSTKEYLSAVLIGALEQLLTVQLDVRSKVGEFFVPTAKSPSFAVASAALLQEADRFGMSVEASLVQARQALLHAKVG